MKIESRLLIQLPALCLLTLSAAACTGSVNLDVTDAPVDQAQNVVVQFSGAVFQPTGASAVNVTFDPPLSIDLLALKNGNTSSLVSGRKLPDGNYDSVALTVNAVGDASDSYVILTGSTTKIPLALSSSNTGGLTITGGFSVSKSETQNYVIDFDLRKSIHGALSGATSYQLIPVLRLVNKDTSGSITGTVTNASATGCAVYVYQGSNATPGDEGSTTPPYTSALIQKDSTTSTYTYTVAFLPPGNYTVSPTCDAAKDSVDVASDITLTQKNNVTVQTGVATTQNLSL